MDPNDGSVLAMATNHSYDQNNPQDLSAWYTESQIKSMTDEEKSKAMKDMLWTITVSQTVLSRAPHLSRSRSRQRLKAVRSVRTIRFIVTAVSRSQIHLSAVMSIRAHMGWRLWRMS